MPGRPRPAAAWWPGPGPPAASEPSSSPRRWAWCSAASIRAATTRSQVGSATSSAKARSAGARRSPSRRDGQGGDLGPDRQRGHGGGGDDGLLQAGRAGHGVAAASPPTRRSPRSAPRPRWAPGAAPIAPGAPQPARPASTAPTGQPVAAPTTTAAPTARPSAQVGPLDPAPLQPAGRARAARRRASRADDQDQPEADPGPAQGGQGAHAPTTPGDAPAGRGRSRPRPAGRGSRCAAATPGTARPSGPGRKTSLETTIGPSASTTSRTEDDEAPVAVLGQVDHEVHGVGHQQVGGLQRQPLGGLDGVGGELGEGAPRRRGMQGGHRPVGALATWR